MTHMVGSCKAPKVGRKAIISPGVLGYIWHATASDLAWQDQRKARCESPTSLIFTLIWGIELGFGGLAPISNTVFSDTCQLHIIRKEYVSTC